LRRIWDIIDIKYLLLTLFLFCFFTFFFRSNKAQTHFPRIRKLTGIPYNKMLFFDDCNWGDHVGMVGRGCTEDNGEGVVGHRTPRGLSVADWYKGLELYKKARS